MPNGLVFEPFIAVPPPPRFSSPKVECVSAGDVVVFAANNQSFPKGEKGSLDMHHGMTIVRPGTSGRCERFVVGLLQPGKENVKRKMKSESDRANNSKRKWKPRE
jgi:hypothetical protein